MKQTKQAGAAALPKSGYFAMVCILIAGSLWGCLGLFNRHLSALGIAPETVVMLRNLGACLILGLIFLVYDRSIFRIRLRHLPIFLCSGLISILFFTLCYFRSQQVSSLAVAAILLYTAPTFVVILSALLWKDRITKRKLAALVLAFLGCCLVSGLGGDTRLSWTGILYGLGAGFGYALYSIFARCALERGYHSNTVTFYACLFAAVGAAAVWGLKAPVTLLVSSGTHLGWSIATGLITGYLPYLLYTYGLTGLETGRASIYANLEPVVATLVGVFAFHEAMTAQNICGILCVLGAVILLSVKTRREKQTQ